MAQKTKKADETVTLKVTDCPQSAPTTVSVNGKKFAFPLGEEVTVPAYVEDALAAVSGVTWEKSEPAAEEPAAEPVKEETSEDANDA